jgi:hypothetical protein
MNSNKILFLQINNESQTVIFEEKLIISSTWYQKSSHTKLCFNLNGIERQSQQSKYLYNTYTYKEKYKIIKCKIRRDMK